MIRLTHRSTGKFIYVVPEHITSARDIEQIGGGFTEVFLTGENVNSFQVKEEAFDVARLKAAWELRYHAPEITENGDLPVAVFLQEEPKSIQFLCCALTRALREQRLAELTASEATSRQREADALEDLGG